MAPADSAPRRIVWGWGLQATGLLTRVAPAFAGQTFTEGYLSQPHVSGRVTLLGGWAELAGTFNLEGLTLRRGELNPGMYGEGYVDRRHPHAYVHDLVASVGWPIRALPGASMSLAAGRGFTPFGTDDPMDRPFAKFPVNHHQAQVMERLLVAAAFRWGPGLIEVGTFTVTSRSAPHARRSSADSGTRGRCAPRHSRSPASS